MRTYEGEVAIIGGGLGAVSAAISLCKSRRKVVMTEVTDWIGGQLTSQGVPPDEYPNIEQIAPSATYQLFRERVRGYYKRNYPLNHEAKNDPLFNPGNAWVSHLSHEPKVAKRVLEDLLAPYMFSGLLTIVYNVCPISVNKKDKKITSVRLKHETTGEIYTVSAKVFLDATETGDLLPLAKVPYTIGSEKKADTLEKHASEVAHPKDTQAFTYVCAVDYVEGQKETIKEPELYQYYKNNIPDGHTHPLLSFTIGNKLDPEPMKTFTLFENDQGVTDLFSYRRIFDCRSLQEPIYEGDVTLLNWPQNDYFFGSIIDEEQEIVLKRLYEAKQLTLSLVYWLQTDAPRLDGGKGYPGIRLRKDVFDTEDGLSKYPYIRESRRIKAVQTIKEEDVSKSANKASGIKRYEDSVGIGHYQIDLHTTAQTKKALYIPSFPYEIPLGSFVQETVDNLIPACKNIGTTHITNGCYRLHPTEWVIGEVAGYLASTLVNTSQSILSFYRNKRAVKNFLTHLEAQGINRHWPKEIERSVLEEMK